VIGAGTIRWPTGEVRWAYHRAAALRDVSITIPRGGIGARTAHARIVEMDAFKVRQSPLLLVLPFGTGGWTILDLTIADGYLTATLGPPVTE
jgi:hypothetical protein